MRGRKFRRGIGLLALTACAAGLVWLVWPRESLLLQRADKVASVALWNFTGQNNGVCPWTWISDREVLIVRQEEAAFLGQPGPSSRPMQICRVDVSSGMETTLEPLSARMNSLQKQNPGLNLCADGPFLSPDRKWLLWDTRSYTTKVCFLATALDGSRVLRWTKEPRSHINYYVNEVLWLPDSRSFLRLQYNRNGIGLRQVIHYPLEMPGPGRVIPLPANPWGGRLLGHLPDGYMLLCNWWTAQPDRGFFAVLDRNTPGQAPRLYALSAPKGTERIWFLALSPQGDRLAWIVHAWPSKEAAWLRWTRNRLGMAPLKRARRLELWVSRTDGGAKRRLGVLKAAWPMLVRFGPCAWSPDGRRIAFTFDNTLYTIPAE